mgnify:FL=1
MQFQVMFKKELLENWRNFKWIWVPIVFIILAIMDPITTYYLPRILETVGGLPEGAVFSIPMPSPAEAVGMSYAQIGSIGVLIVAVISMGTIAGEIRSGVYEMILSKPVSYANYIMSKFSAYSLIILLSLIVSMIASWYYVSLLFGDIAFSTVIVSAVFYTFYLLFILSITVVLNTLLKSPGLVAFLTIIIVIALNIITDIFSHVLTWSPLMVSNHTLAFLYDGSLTSELIGSVSLAIIFTALLLVVATMILQRRAFD